MREKTLNCTKKQENSKDMKTKLVGYVTKTKKSSFKKLWNKVDLAWWEPIRCLLNWQPIGLLLLYEVPLQYEGVNVVRWSAHINVERNPYWMSEEAFTVIKQTSGDLN